MFLFSEVFKYFLYFDPCKLRLNLIDNESISTSAELLCDTIRT